MEALTQSPPIIENIFKHLPARSLCLCSQVCKLWNVIAKTEFKRRTCIDWFFQGSLSAFDNPFLARFKDHPLREKLSGNDDSFDSSLDEQLSNMHCRTGLCIAFVSNYLYENFDDFFPSCTTVEPDKKRFKHECLIHQRKYIRTILRAVMKQHMPKDASISFSIAPGIIACMEDYTPVEVEDGPGITGFCFPKLPGVETYYISVDGQKSNLLMNAIPESSEIKCLLTFLTPRGLSAIDKLIHRCLVVGEGQFALGGSLVNHTESLVGSVIAFCGENVEAASLVIDQDDKKEKIKCKLKAFQETGLLCHRCYAFMFTCVARGFHFHKQHNLESDIFRSLYPRVPLIGVFGNGEIGVNYLPHLPTKNETIKIGSLIRSSKKYRYSYSTVFVLLSVKV